MTVEEEAANRARMVAALRAGSRAMAASAKAPVVAGPATEEEPMVRFRSKLTVAGELRGEWARALRGVRSRAEPSVVDDRVRGVLSGLDQLATSAAGQGPVGFDGLTRRQVDALAQVLDVSARRLRAEGGPAAGLLDALRVEVEELVWGRAGRPPAGNSAVAVQRWVNRGGDLDQWRASELWR